MTSARPRIDQNLMTLLEVQDLRSKLRELEGESELEELEETHFNIDPAEAAAQLRDRLTSLEGDLGPRVKRRYDRVKDHLDRVVVPVINGVCYGCFVSIATATAGEEEPHQSLRSCENCGRFIYILP